MQLFWTEWLLMLTCKRKQSVFQQERRFQLGHGKCRIPVDFGSKQILMNYFWSMESAPVTGEQWKTNQTWLCRV